MEEENSKKAILPLFRKLVSFPARYYLPEQLQTKAQARLSHLKKKKDIDYLNEVYLAARECYEALSVKLGDKKYFFGDEFESSPPFHRLEK